MRKFLPILTALLLSLLSLGAQATPATPVTLATDTQIPLVVEGKTVGSMTLKAGTSVTITKVLPNNEGVLITRGETAPAKLPVEAISPESLAAAQAAQTVQASTLATQVVAPQATPAPTPTAINTKVSKENLALYQKIESLIKFGHKKTSGGDPDPGFALLNYQTPEAPSLNSLVGKTLQRAELTNNILRPQDLPPNVQSFKILAVRPDRNLSIEMMPRMGMPGACTIETGRLPKETKMRLFPNAKILEGKNPRAGAPTCVFKKLIINGATLEADTLEVEAQPFTEFTPESIAAALSN